MRVAMIAVAAMIVVITVVSSLTMTVSMFTVPGATMAVVHLMTAEFAVGMASPVIVLPVIAVAAMGEGAAIAVAGIVIAIDGTVPIARPMVPGSSADEDAAVEPCGSVVAPGSAVVRRVREIAVGANRGGTDLYGDLRLGARRGREQKDQRERGCGDD